ncbi:hypothetical protein G7054_g9917 [Neopestalotiopsis clavispora]|nr:hypothetical protein G7054_g9917 [Neopestalotiopsis clavispora]
MGEAMSDQIGSSTVTLENIEEHLAHDHKVKVGGIDCDGILRGKIISKEKFLSSLKGGFGMSSALFAWDMHDVLYTEEVSISSEKSGFGDFIAQIDLESFRRLPFENDIAFFLLRFNLDGNPMFADGRSLVLSTTKAMAKDDIQALAGVELEFMNFETPSQDGYASTTERRNLASFLLNNTPRTLRPITDGMFGYSVSRPLMNKGYFHSIYDSARQLGCPLEGWHTESGPGVYEAVRGPERMECFRAEQTDHFITQALAVSPVARMADNVSIFKFLTKSLGAEYGITPCFMAKPAQGLPGNSGHIHLSLVDSTGKNLFAREEEDKDAQPPDVANLSKVGQQFLAGLIDALPDIMPMLAPNVNSYKRLVENFWAPMTAAATRFEIRIPGADLHPHYALTALLRAGLRGIERKMDITLPPLSQLPDGQQPARLPNTLGKAVERFQARESLARVILGDEFVDFYSTSRRHELSVWREAVTDCLQPPDRKQPQSLSAQRKKHNMSTLEKISTINAAPAAGPYSQAIKLSASNGLIFTSGQLPSDAMGTLSLDDPIEVQTEKCILNLQAILEAGGSSLDSVIKTVVFITDMKDFPKVNQVYEKYFTHKPARSCVAVAQLPKNASVEIESVAQVD